MGIVNHCLAIFCGKIISVI